MIHRNICPICGSENPEGSEICQVCRANLVALPSEVFPVDEPEQAEPEEIKETGTEIPENEEPDLEHPVPVWLKTKLKPTEKMDFDSYSDMIFGTAVSSNSSSPVKTIKPQKYKRTGSIYQSPLQKNLVEPPLIEPDGDSAKYISEEISGIADFLLQRPARKWEERKPQLPLNKGTGTSILTNFSSERPAKKWDDRPLKRPSVSKSKEKPQTAAQLPLWWQQDSPLVELDDMEETLKAAEADDPALEFCASPTKVVNASDFFEAGSVTLLSDSPQENKIENPEDFQPESGSLLSDLLNEINSNSETLTPAEQQENQDGTVFFSGNHPEEDNASKPEADLGEITFTDDDQAANAAFLDRILRNIGYEVEGEPKPENKPAEPAAETSPSEPEEQISGTDETKEPEKPVKNENKAEETAKNTPSLRGFYIPSVIDNPLIPPDDTDDSDETDTDPYGLDDEDMGVEETEFEQDIPWDLFGSADMALPQSPEDPEYRTFSRSGIPVDPDNNTYQQRMISSVLGKIIQAENFVQPRKEENNRKISYTARAILAFLAIFGTLMILTTGLTDQIIVPSVHESADTEGFIHYTEMTGSSALVIVDYTPAYDSVMKNAAVKLIDSLEANSDKVSIAVLNPAAMTNVRQLLTDRDGKAEFAGWWPAGVISIRSHIKSGDIPNQIWLLTSDIVSVRSWAEQLLLTADQYQLHVMAPGQLNPLMKPYLRAGMITSMLSQDEDLLHYGDKEHPVDRTQFAVWYLAALIPLAWIFGIFSNFMKKEPKYGIKTVTKPEEPQYDYEKEPENGRRI